MRKKLGILLTAGVFALTAFSGCGSSSSGSGNGGMKILVSLNDDAIFRKQMLEAASVIAENEGVQLDVKNADQSMESQSASIKSAEADGYDAIICSPVSSDTAMELEEGAGDLPIIFINSCPDDKCLEADKYIYVGSDESVAGQYQAEYILDALPDKNELNVVILKGQRNHSATDGRTNGAKKTLEASGKTINYVFDDYAGWESDPAEEMFKIFLTTGRTPDCVICNNDSMALGVVEACKDENINLSSLPIVGVDATAEGCEAIENGDMAFTVYQSAKGQGEAAIQAAIRLAKGNSVSDMEGVTEDGKYLWVPFERVDENNVGDYY
ncbi:MAG: substrate-binding domain-containing protein [Roseburia sp.]